MNLATGSLLYNVNENDPTDGFMMSTERTYNLNSAGWCYPDVAYYLEGQYYYLTVAFQDPDDNFAKACSRGVGYLDPEMIMGSCKTPTLRGISLDHIEPEYYFTEDSGIRSSWTNPGGITAIWRSDVTIPNTQDKYGIDSINLEYKNDHIRIAHKYWNGSDDEENGTDYDPTPVYHETSNSADEYIDIKSVPDCDSHVSFKRNNAIWYFSLTRYY